MMPCMLYYLGAPHHSADITTEGLSSISVPLNFPWLGQVRPSALQPPFPSDVI